VIARIAARHVVALNERIRAHRAEIVKPLDRHLAELDALYYEAIERAGRPHAVPA
jgi:hypothetical protein